MTGNVKTRFSQNDNEFLNRLKEGDEQAFQSIYDLYETHFCQWAFQNFNLKEPEVFDVFQEAVAGIYLNLREGKLTELTCEFQTYLFAIAKNLLLKRMGVEHRYELVEDFSPEELEVEVTNDVVEEKSEEAKALIEKTGEPCKSILKAYYLYNWSMVMIAQDIGYKSADVVKAQKLRCLNYLKKLMKK